VAGAALFVAGDLRRGRGREIRAKGLWADTRAAAPYVGFAISLVILAFLCARWTGACPSATRRRALTWLAAVREDLERPDARRGWVGSGAYGAASSWRPSRRSMAPVNPVLERGYSFETAAIRADFSRPGLVWPAGMTPPARSAILLRQRPPLGEIDRARQRPQPLRLFLVSGPKRDVDKVGC